MKPLKAKTIFIIVLLLCTLHAGAQTLAWYDPVKAPPNHVLTVEVGIANCKEPTPVCLIVCRRICPRKCGNCRRMQQD